MRVNSHNEWSRLREVIVGAGFPEAIPSAEFGFKIFFHNNIYNTTFHKNASEYICKKDIEEHNEDVDNFVRLLTELDVVVKRPKIPPNITTTKTLTFESTNYPALNPRDLVMIVGDEIIETPPVCRYRYFENDYMKHLFMEYFKSGSKWTVAPRPLLLDSSYDLSYVCDTDDSKNYYESLRQSDQHMLNIGHEIMFDAANCMRLGKHIVMNVSNKNAELGFKWLSNHLGDTYTVWPVNITDWHIDSTFVPIRPGLAIVGYKHVIDKLPEPLKKWDFIVAPDEIALQFREKPMLASPLIDINVLSIDENTVIVNSEHDTILVLDKLLKPHGVDVIGCSLRHSEKFGGAHHCLTVDTVRDSSLENYFN